ncbi:MAG: pyrroline-5-carboxylate reductase [Clostridia bacterium]
MKLGVIGAGNIAGAIVKGVVKAGIIAPENLIVSDIHDGKLAALRELGVTTTLSNTETAEKSEVILLAIKPNIAEKVLNEIRPFIGGKLLVSVVAGFTRENIAEIVGSDVRIVRTMPNVPALVGEGMTVLCRTENVSDKDFNDVQEIFNAIGKTSVLDEHLFDAATATNGSGPAYVFVMIEAMADAAVLQGIPRDTAYLLVEQTILGSAKLALETREHPGKLKDMVCSPGGTTIEAIYRLEEKGLRATMIDAVDACAKKSALLGKK